MRNLYFMVALLAVAQLSLAEGRFCNYTNYCDNECSSCLCEGNVCSVCGDYGPQECVYTVGGEDANYPAFPAYDPCYRLVPENVQVELCGEIRPAILEVNLNTSSEVDCWWQCNGEGEPSGGDNDYCHFMGWNNIVMCITYDSSIFDIKYFGAECINIKYSDDPNMQKLCLLIEDGADIVVSAVSKDCEFYKKARNKKVEISAELYRAVRSIQYITFAMPAGGCVGWYCMEACYEDDGEGHYVPKFKGEKSFLKDWKIGIEFTNTGGCENSPPSTAK